MGSTCGSSLISCYSLLPSFPLTVSHILFFFLLFSPSYTHAHFHSFSLFIANSLFVEEEWEAYLPTIWWCQGRPEQMCSALGLCSIKHMHTHTHIHRGLHRACYRGRVHWLTTALSNSQCSHAGGRSDKTYSKDPLNSQQGFKVKSITASIKVLFSNYSRYIVMLRFWFKAVIPVVPYLHMYKHLNAKNEFYSVVFVG